MTLPFSSARLGLAVAAERRGQPLDELLEPQLKVEHPRTPALPPAPLDPRPNQADWARPTQADAAGTLRPDTLRQPLPLAGAPAPLAQPPLQAANAPQHAAPALASPAPTAPPAPPLERASPEAGSAVDRRIDEQPAKRILGTVVAVNGARATIATKASSAEHMSLDAWGIGKLISINLGASRIVGMVYEMKVESGDLAEGIEGTLLVQAELVGEVVETADKRLKFRRGIVNYPWLGAPAHRIRSADLRAVFDLGDRKGVEIGRVSQDETIPATVSFDDLLSKHFAVVGTTGVGKSSAVSLLVRKAAEVKPELRVLILDPHNEYAHAFRDLSITLDVNSLDLPVWLFRFEELLDVIYRGRPAPDGEADLLRELIPLAKSQFAAYSSMNFGASLLRKQADGLLFSLDSPSPYRMLDLLALLDEMMGKLDQRHDRYHMRVLKGRLESLVTDARYRFMFGKGATEDNLESIIGRIFRIPHDQHRITVLQLAGLPSEVLNSVVSILSRLSFEVAMWSSAPSKCCCSARRHTVRAAGSQARFRPDAPGHRPDREGRAQVRLLHRRGHAAPRRARSDDPLAVLDGLRHAARQRSRPGDHPFGAVGFLGQPDQFPIRHRQSRGDRFRRRRRDPDAHAVQLPGAIGAACGRNGSSRGDARLPRRDEPAQRRGQDAWPGRGRRSLNLSDGASIVLVDCCVAASRVCL